MDVCKAFSHQVFPIHEFYNSPLSLSPRVLFNAAIATVTIESLQNLCLYNPKKSPRLDYHQPPKKYWIATQSPPNLSQTK